MAVFVFSWKSLVSIASEICHTSKSFRGIISHCFSCRNPKVPYNAKNAAYGHLAWANMTKIDSRQFWCMNYHPRSPPPPSNLTRLKPTKFFIVTVAIIMKLQRNIIFSSFFFHVFFSRTSNPFAIMPHFIQSNKANIIPSFLIITGNGIQRLNKKFQ